MGCLFIATKTEEQKKSVREIITCFDRVLKLWYGVGLEEFANEARCDERFRTWNGPAAMNRELLERVSDVYPYWKDLLFEIELEILAQLGYKAFCELPHKYVLTYIQVLEGDQDFAQRAWNYLNDCLQDPLCIEHNPELLACAAISLAAQDMGILLPDKPHWFELFQVQEEQIAEVCGKITKLHAD
eukprot:TRINITY_DN4578_c0_g1_i1.p1 TRINITY_DN4578_c0_g1~~TRINITY_DN4578_c0_g1_i1.p1  ORF type:complete len:186 (+),score=49.47 TRINITY_DN4578_c0_g1_i1:211-768(+)